MAITRKRYQSGCLYRERRKASPDAWVFRYRDGEVNRKVNIGTTEEYRTRSAAMKAVEELRGKINRETRSPRTIAELVSHYREKELTEDSRKSFSTRKAYAIYLRNWIVPAWGERLLSDVRTIAVEDWLHGLTLSNGSKAKIRTHVRSIQSRDSLRVD